MIKSELNIQLLSGGKVFNNKFIHVRLIWDFDFWQSKQNIVFGGSNFNHLYFSGQLCWKFRFVNFDFGLLNKLIILRLSFNICQQRGSQLCTWIFKLVLGNVGNLSLFNTYVLLWILVLALLLILWILNQNIVLRRFCKGEITFPCFFFFWNTIWSMYLVWLSKPAVSRIEEKARLLLIFHHCICPSFYPSLCHLSPFLRAYVTISRPCHLSNLSAMTQEV